MAKQQPWTQIGSRWEQDLGLMARFYVALSPLEGQLMHWMVAGTVRFKYNGPTINIEDTLRRAWTEMRYKFPALAIRISGQKKVYETPDDSALSAWLASSFQVHHDQTVEDVLEGLVLSPYVTMHFFPPSNQLMISTAHTFIDGRGILYLYNAFFQAVATPSSFHFGDEPDRLPLSEDTLLGLGETVSEEDKQNASMLIARFAHDRPIRMPVDSLERPPTGTARQELRLSRATSDAVTSACKQKGFTVTSAWHAALVHAVTKIQLATGDVGTSYTSFTNFDLRPYFPKGFDPCSQPVSCYHTAIPFRVDTEAKSFDDISREVHEHYQTGFRTDTVNVSMLPAMIDVLLASFATGVPPSSTPVLSSIGVIDRYLNRSFGPHWEIEDVWVADTMLTPEVEAFLWSWDGHIVLSGSFNLTFYSTADVEKLLATIKEEMLGGLGVTE